MREMECGSVIYICISGHYYSEDGMCPHCGKVAVRNVEYRNGDCCFCGVLCPGHAYGCDDPQPIVESKDIQRED